MSESTPLRVALVGLGGHGRTIQRAADEATALQVVAVYDPVEVEAEEAAAHFGCAAASSYEALLARDDVEAVVLVTPNHLHRSQAEAAFTAGKHVLVEKPLASTVADGMAMIEAAEAADRVLMVGHNMRHGRTAHLARQMIDEGRLGEVVSIEIHFSLDAGFRLTEDAWRLRPDQSALLPVVQLGIHAIDLVHDWIGSIVEVFALARSVATEHATYDSVTATFRAAPGVLGTLVSNYCTQVTFQLRLAGTEGSLRYTPHTLWFRRRENTNARGEGPSEVHDFRGQDLDSFVRQMEAFVEAVRTGAPLETDGWAGVQALAVVEAMQRSVERQAPHLVRQVKQDR